MSNLIRSRIWKGKPGGGDGSGSGGGPFNGERPITRNTPGILGFDPNTTTIDAFLDQVFYPPLPPLASISVNNPIREIGQSTAYTLTWAATEQSNAITGITVDGTVIAPVTGVNQNGTQNGNLPASSGSYTKTMTDTDGTLTGTASCTVQYLNRMFWGTTAKSGLGGSPILDSDILAVANSGLVSNRTLTLKNFGGGNTYLIFAFPSMFGAPQFVVNGLTNTAFTKVRSASNFVNIQGATIVMDVWVSNNLYNSPLGSVIIQ